MSGRDLEEMEEAVFNDRFLSALSEWDIPQVEGLARHAWLVREKNRVMNLTRITAPEEMAVRHALDSVVAAPLLEEAVERPMRRILDLGTGAGWPGIALATVAPQLQVTLLDARRKKIDFLSEAVVDLGLDDRVGCAWSRFEDFIRPARQDYDLIVARAVGPVSRLLEWCTGNWFGPIMLWKGPALAEELREAEPLLRKRRLDITLDLDYELPGDPTPYRIVMLEPDPG